MISHLILSKLKFPCLSLSIIDFLPCFWFYSTVYYGEYKCYGPGANRTERVEWSRSLSSDEAVPFLTKEMIGGQGWLRPAPTHFMRGSSVITMNTDGKN